MRCRTCVFTILLHRHTDHITEVFVFGVTVVGQDVHDDVQHHHIARHYIVFVNLVWLEITTYRHLDFHNPPTFNFTEEGVHLGELLNNLRAAIGNRFHHFVGKGVAQTFGVGEDLNVVVIDGSAAFEPEQRGDDVLATAIDARDGLWLVEGENELVVLAVELVVLVDDGEEVLRHTDNHAFHKLIDRNVEGHHLDAFTLFPFFEETALDIYDSQPHL